MHTYTAGGNLRITVLEERLSFKNFVVTLISGEWPDFKKVVDCCETGYQHAKIDFFPHDGKAFVRVYTD